MRTFRSDNNAGICPEALAAMASTNNGSHTAGYGDDHFTALAVDAFRSIFGEQTTVFFVATGSAANTLAIASLTEPWQRVLCHYHSHWNADESTAPERLTHCRTTAIHTDASKLTPLDLEPVLNNGRDDVHQPQPGVLTITNPTEFGTVYTPDEVRLICEMAHSCGYRVHIDGARFANAVASLDCHPAQLANEAGVDAMSFGGTKNGLAYGEAVLFFPQGDGEVFKRAVHTFEFHRKSTGHLLSKHRFVSAPFAATLSMGCWLRHASQSNEMARMLGQGLYALGLEPRFPVETNGVFVSLPANVHAILRQAGHSYYPFGEAAWNLSRFMCSYDTTAVDVNMLLDDVRRAMGR